MKGTVFGSLAAVALGLASLALGLWANHSIRLGLLVAHTPISWTAAVLPGPAAVQGQVVVDQQTLRGPFTSQQCVYYRKLVEREKKDSDGNTSWETVEDIARQVPFQVHDRSGSMLVRPDGAEIRAPQIHRHQEGKMRYTEFAILPGRDVFVFGHSDGERLRTADKVPFLVTALGEEEYRQGKGFQSVLLCTFAILCAAFCVFFACMTFRWHHVFVYLSLLTTAIPLWLFLQWFVLARAQFEFADESLAAAEQHIAHTPPDTTSSALMKEVYNDGIQRLELYRAKLPNRLLAWSVGLRRFQPIELSAVEHERAQAYPLPPRPDVALSAWIGWIFGITGTVALIGFGLKSFGRLKTKRLIENLPTTPAAGVVVGATELTGNAVAEPTWLTAPYTATRCAWYKHVTKERRGTGKNAKWVVIDSGEAGTPFLLQDESGEVRVHPEKAVITGRQSMHKREGRLLKMEWLVDQDDPLYILGSAQLVGAEDDFLSITHDGETPYLISIKSETDVQMSFARRGFLASNGAMIGGTVALLTTLAMRGFSPFDFFLAGLFPPLYLAIISLFFMFNDLVFLRNRMHRALSMIDVALKKRADLVPQLVDVTRAYLKHEHDTQEALAAMRATAGESVAELQQTMALQATGVLKWLGVVEQNPNLKGSEVVQQLQHRLTGLENEIAFCRQSYNDTLERYNSRIGTLPDLVIAKTCGFRPATYLEFESDIQQVPSASSQ